MAETPASDPTPSPSAGREELPPPGVSGCIGMAITGTLLVGLWLALTLFVYAWLGKAAAAGAFFGPVLLVTLWVQFSKPVGEGDGGLPKS